MDDAKIRALIDKAAAAQNQSYAPYSQFNVGAALLAADGSVTTGCNIENASYGNTCCAERVAFFKAISEAAPYSAGRVFRAIAIVGGYDMTLTDYCPPCGICRQVMREFCTDDFIVILGRINTDTSKIEYKTATLGELLPLSFGPDNINA